ncbi:MAG: class I SAM-dependent methyltransferase [Nevskiales bacterium]
MTTALVLLCTEPQRQAQAAALAQRLELPLLGNDQGHSFAWRLVLTASGLELRTPLSPAPIYPDLLGLEVRRRIAAGRQQPFARAFGLHRGGAPSVLDATAGLGRDSSVLGGLGCRVAALERQPVIHALLSDAAERLAVLSPIRLLPCQDALAYWSDDTMERPDIIYLDPMYPLRGKAALAKKEAQVLRAMAGDDADADSLLAPALAQARQRVVVKRHPQAPWLANKKPAHSILGKRARYDVYLTR